MADKRMVRGEEKILLAFHALIFIFLQSFAGKRNIIAVLGWFWENRSFARNAHTRTTYILQH